MGGGAGEGSNYFPTRLLDGAVLGDPRAASPLLIPTVNITLVEVQSLYGI